SRSTRSGPSRCPTTGRSARSQAWRSMSATTSGSCSGRAACHDSRRRPGRNRRAPSAASRRPRSSSSIRTATSCQPRGGEGTGYEWPKQEHGIRVDKDFVWFGGNHKDDGFLLKFTRDGKFVMQIGKSGPRKGDNDTTQLGQPADFWIDAATNELYVADG